MSTFWTVVVVLLVLWAHGATAYLLGQRHERRRQEANRALVRLDAGRR